MTLIIILVILALGFALLNGIHDSSNIVATMISSRAFAPRVALGVTAVCEFSGPFIFGVAVATTIGHDIVSSEAISLEVLIAALLGAILWNLLTWYLGIPSSSSHAIIGGILGSVWVGAGGQAIQMKGIEKVLIALFTSPIIGLIFGFLITKFVTFLVSGSSPKVNWFFKRGQILTAMALALSHGANDAQKSMGIITLALVSGGYIDSFHVPLWVVVACSFMIALGTSLGGWSLIRTLGSKFYKIRPIHGFNSQLASAIVILGNSLLGGPVSTTQVVSTAIMGVGAAERISKVRWSVASEILMAWFLTIPSTAIVAAGIYWIIMQFKSLM
jgi:inorganic phosphate transporter, PiT family